MCAEDDEEDAPLRGGVSVCVWVFKQQFPQNS